MAEENEERVDGVEDGPVEAVEEPVKEGVDGKMDDLFGDEEQESGPEESGDGEEKTEESESEGENDERPGRGGTETDDEEAEEQAMYTRKFYGEDADNASDEEEAAHRFKEQDVELVRHIVPYKTVDDEKEGKSTIYYAKVPEYLTIDPVPFDPPSFKSKVEQRLKSSSKEDQLGDRLIDENTIRWRYSRDENQQVYKESNAQIVQWSDGSFSLKLGAEYTDILVNDTDNTFFAVSHDQQELMQCYQGGEITKSLMFIPTSTNSKMYQKLTKAVIRRDQKQASGPGVYIVNRDPELEKSELEKKQQQVIRERRRRQLKETESRNSPDPSSGLGSYRRNPVASENEQDAFYGSSRRNEYEQDDFLVDDDEEEEAPYSDENDVLDDNDEEIDAEEANAERLRQLKREGAEKYRDRESGSDFTTKRRKVAIIDDDDDE
ncbi:hypothetical protein HG536_0F02750 [Torulaspora globosa]|uniref:Leo1-like protein n=1 Tax=Torulaspora globosa TaxID=48254 RepID=A0A7G3ZKB4_9SACH|nr:uncharacterized protein HG536_0F02750 [Torulaspora globosa]QLL33950.1 hypothetical protein HG536_0F02750 [Torulaspora globosa]